MKKKPVVEEVVEEALEEIITPAPEPQPVEEAPQPVEEEKPKTKTAKKVEQKYKNGSIVLINNSVSADLKGFKLFPQYKKCTYTVESFDATTKVYSLRRLNLLLQLHEEDLLAPGERAHDQLNKAQY